MAKLFTEAERAIFQKLAAAGGRGRAKKLTSARRSAIAKQAAKARWGKREKGLAS